MTESADGPPVPDSGNVPTTANLSSQLYRRIEATRFGTTDADIDNVTGFLVEAPPEDVAPPPSTLQVISTSVLIAGAITSVIVLLLAVLTGTSNAALDASPVVALLLTAVAGAVSIGARRTAVGLRREAARQLDIDRDAMKSWVRPGSAEISDEGAIAIVAATVAKRIIAHRAWSAELLDTHRLRLNPVEEARQIATRAAELHRLRIEVREAPQVSTYGSQPAAVLDRYAAQLHKVEAGLVARVVALDAYLAHLDQLVPLLEAADALERLADLSQRIERLAIGTVTDEMAIADIRALDREIAEVIAGLRAAVDYLATAPRAI